MILHEGATDRFLETKFNQGKFFKSMELTGTLVFELHKDRLGCGVCGYKCTDVLSLLAHKLQHSISDNIYKCDLCQILCSSSELLENHYHDLHKVALCFTHPHGSVGEQIGKQKRNEAPNKANKSKETPEKETYTDKSKEAKVSDNKPDTKKHCPPKEHFKTNSMNSICDDDSCSDVSELWENGSSSEDNTGDEDHVISTIKVQLPLSGDKQEDETFMTADSIKECYVEVVKADPEKEDSNSEDKSSPKVLKKLSITDVFNEEAETPFLLVTESQMINSKLQFETWLVCIFCAHRSSNRVALLSHMFEVHPKMKIEDLKVIDIDGTVKKSGIMEGKPAEAQYTKTLITLGEYNKLFLEENSVVTEGLVKENLNAKENLQANVGIKRKLAEAKDDQTIKKKKKGHFRLTCIEEKNKKDERTLTEEEINNIKLILVTESSAMISNLYLKIWLVCLQCSHKLVSRNAFVNHMVRCHQSALSEGPNFDLKDVIENSGLLKDQPPEIKFTSTVMSIAEYDRFVPVITSKSMENKTDKDKDEKSNEKPIDEKNEEELLVEKYNERLLQKTQVQQKKKSRRLEKQDITGVFPCEKCSKEFTRLRYLRRHIRIHEEGSSHVCKECNKAFKTTDLLRQHRKNVHYSDKTYRCKTCPFESTVNSTIHIHRQLHPDGSVLCEICGKAYCDKSTLAKHMRVHDSARAYACEYEGCSWRFKNEVRMKAHYRMHFSSGKFKCQICGYLFRRKQHLQRHETTLHGVPPPKPRPYRNQIVNDDLIEIPSEQLEINEACTFIDQPMVITIGSQEQPIIYETSWSGTL